MANQDYGHVTNGQVQSPASSVSQGIYETSSVQKGPLGTKLEFADGRIFRYCHFVAGVNRGVLCAQDISVTGFGPIDGKATAASAGATEITLTDTDTFSTADAEDVYAGGYLFTEDDAGEGYTYRIRGNDQGTAAGVMKLDLYDGLAAALTTDSDVAVVGSIWSNLKIASANTDAILAGVSMATNAAGAYGWVQTWGAANVLAELIASSAPSIGNPAFLDDGTDGAVMAFGGVASNTTINAGDWDTPYVGDFMETATDAAHVGVFLKIQP